MNVLRRLMPDPKSAEATIIDVSDLHRGHVLAPWPKSVLLSGGSEWKPNRVQEWIDEKWREFWNWADELSNKTRRILVFHGDLCEGPNGRNVELITPEMSLQRRAGKETILSVKKPGDVVEIIRGTAYHVGSAAENEETVAEAVGCEQIMGAYSRYALRFAVNGVRFLLAHHIGQSYSPVTETSPLIREMTKAARDSGRWGHEFPDIMGFGHVHRFVEVRLPARRQGQYCYVIPGWVGQGEFGMKVDPISPTQVGGMVIQVHAGGTWENHPKFWSLPMEEYKPL